MSADEDVASALEDDDIESHILAVHLGHAANCSSVGSVVDFLFVSAVAGAALMAAVAATLGKAESERGREEEEEEEDASPADLD
jgi:hypothetical protein